jgi:hypothetical protein
MRPTPSALSVLALAITIGVAHAADVTGSWEYSGPAQSGLWLKTRQAGDKVRFQLELARGAPSYNSGWLEGEIKLAGTTGVFRSNENGACEIAFEFAPTFVQIKEAPEQNACGFGFNVHADGKLRRKSVRPPKFSASDPRFVGPK